ncbi:L-serine ammonia-lyase, partial [Acinetobacter baumannii]
DGAAVLEETYYSVGGGFIRRDGEEARVTTAEQPFPFRDAEELMALCDENGMTIAEIARANETVLRSEEEVAAGLDAIWDAMS